MELSATARVVLGMIRHGKRTGYEIKQLVDVSTRFFWAASYGQLYPELKRLEDEGLIESEDASTNGRRRRAYALTERGEEALDAWLRSMDAPTFELRDEGMLKIFFSDAMEPHERVELVRRMRRRHEQVIERLRTIEPRARARGGGPYATLRTGLALHEFCAGWLTDLEGEFADQLTERR